MAGAHPTDVVGDVRSIFATKLDPALQDTDDPPVIAPHRSAVMVEASARRTEALGLVLAGLTYEQVGERLHISTEGARDLVHRTLHRAENRQVEAMRTLENARLDRAQAAIWTQVLSGDLKAVDTFLRLSQRRARMNGLDAPTSIALSVTVREEMEAAFAALEQIVLTQSIDAAREADATSDREEQGLLASPS